MALDVMFELDLTLELRLDLELFCEAKFCAELMGVLAAPESELVATLTFTTVRTLNTGEVVELLPAWSNALMV